MSPRPSFREPAEAGTVRAEPLRFYLSEGNTLFLDGSVYRRFSHGASRQFLFVKNDRRYEDLMFEINIKDDIVNP